MADLALTAFLTRQGQPDLNLNDGVNYTLGRGFKPGQVSWRKESVESPFVHGRLVVNEVRASSESTAVVYVAGENHQELNQNLDTLLRAFEQRDYVLRMNVEGQDYRWKCESADYEVSFVTEYLNALYLAVALSFNRHPIPVEGPL